MRRKQRSKNAKSAGLNNKVNIGIAISFVVVFGLALGCFYVLDKSIPDVEDLVSQQSKISETTPTPKTPPTPSELLELTNIERAKVGVAPLQLDERLNQSAQWKAEDMEARSYYNHADPTTGKLNGLDKARLLAGCKTVSENLANTGITLPASETIRNWLNSKSHKEALLSPAYELVGFGISQDYVVQHFCDL